MRSSFTYFWRDVMGYVIATTEQTVKWYVFDPKTVSKSNFELIDKLDLNQVSIAGDKATAKLWAQEMGLKTWRYVRL